MDEYVERFLAALKLPDKAERWNAWKELGIKLSDDDFAAAEARVESELARERRNGGDRMEGSRTTDREEYVHAVVFSHWATRDVRSAAEWAHRMQSFPRSRSLPVPVFSPDEMREECEEPCLASFRISW